MIARNVGLGIYSLASWPQDFFFIPRTPCLLESLSEHQLRLEFVTKTGVILGHGSISIRGRPNAWLVEDNGMAQKIVRSENHGLRSG